MSNNRFGPLSTVPEPAAASITSAPATSSQQQQQQQQKPGETRSPATPRKRKGHRGGKKKRPRRKSFAVLDDDDATAELEGTPSEAFYQLPQANLSGTSIDSEALLDHRSHQPMRIRRASTVATSNPFQRPTASPSASRLRSVLVNNSDNEDRPSPSWDESAPLLSPATGARPSLAGLAGYGSTRDARGSRPQSRRASSKSSRTRQLTGFNIADGYDINHPPSVPGSPNFGASNNITAGFGDVMMRDDIDLSPGHSADEDGDRPDTGGTLRDQRGEHSRRLAADAGADVCFPGPEMSEIGEEDFNSRDPETQQYRSRRRRRRWPDLATLEEWQQMEKEGRSDERRVMKITEPQLINGRLRPVRKGWFQTDEEAPFRFTYFNEDFQSTIHSQTISELVQPGGGFKELFMPDPRILSDDEESETDDELVPVLTRNSNSGGVANGESKVPTRQPSLGDARPDETITPLKTGTTTSSGNGSGQGTPAGLKSPEYNNNNKSAQSALPEPQEKPVRYGERPIWWLDVLCPTESEMKVLSKAFGIHPLTAEDIMLQEAREKVELFRHYYFVNYRTFDQDINSENYLEPVNMYVVVFREGVLSFHFSVTPHPANVRRRIRQLKDYLILSSDWISYAIIDDITDVFQPLIQTIEDEVDDIDEGILRFQSLTDKRLKDDKAPITGTDDATTVFDSSADMLRRVGDCRKRVMSLYRLLGNKADVIKGFAKRCNERWEVAPRSEIGLYLGDIQDHIVTMTSNLGHYEKILARSHANYLAQINIRMNERSEQTADVLGKLTVLGTIVLPMNIITGLWGMNVWVPGQGIEGDLTWFMCITACLCAFGLACFLIAKRVYKIV